MIVISVPIQNRDKVQAADIRFALVGETIPTFGRHVTMFEADLPEVVLSDAKFVANLQEVVAATARGLSHL